MIHRTEVADAFSDVGMLIADLVTEMRRAVPDYTRCADLTQRVGMRWEHAVALSSSWVATAVLMGAAAAEANRN